MRVPVQQYLANSAHFGLTEPWLSIPAAQLACLLVLRPCALAALHITAPFVPLTLDLVQFEDVQHLTQLKWDLQVGKDYYTGENGLLYRGTFSDANDPHRIVWTKQSSALTKPVVCDDALSKLEVSLHSSSRESLKPIGINLIEGGGSSKASVVDI